MKFKNNYKENTKSNEKTYLNETPKQNNDNKKYKLGTVLINNNRYELNLSSARNDNGNSVKFNKVYNFSNEDRIFSISPYIIPNYIGEFSIGQDEQKKNQITKRKNIKNKIIQHKKGKENLVVNDFEKKKKMSNTIKKKSLEDYNKEILKQLDEQEKLIQLEDEERQRKFKEGLNINQLNDEDEKGEIFKELEQQENQIKTPEKDEREIKEEEIPKDYDKNEFDTNLEFNVIQDSDNKRQLLKEEDLLNNNKEEKNDASLNKQLKEEERDKTTKIKEEITLDELNILIKSAINEIFLPKTIDNLIYDKTIIMIKCLSEDNKKLFIKGLKDGIMIKEDVNRYNIFLSKLLGKIKDDHFLNQMKLKPFNEEEYSCHCKCHYEYSKEEEDCDE